MRQRCGLALVLLGLASLSFPADWRDVSLEVLVRESTSIVLAPLVGSFERTRSGDRRGVAILVPYQWLLTPGERPEVLLLLWNGGAVRAPSRLDHGSRQGRRGLWLLVDSPDGVVSANHPRRWVKPSEMDRVRSLIAANPIRLALLKAGTKRKKPAVRVTLSNPGPEAMTVPWIQVHSDGKVEWPDTFELVVRRSERSEEDLLDADDPRWYWDLLGVEGDRAPGNLFPVPARESRFIRRVDPTRLRLPGDEASRRDLSIPDLYDCSKPGTYYVFLKTRDGWRSNTLCFTDEDLRTRP